MVVEGGNVVVEGGNAVVEGGNVVVEAGMVVVGGGGGGGGGVVVEDVVDTVVGVDVVLGREVGVVIGTLVVGTVLGSVGLGLETTDVVVVVMTAATGVSSGDELVGVVETEAPERLN
jgi:hypothetical protein